MLTRLILAPLAALLLASSAGAQTPPIIVGPAGSYTVQTPGATKVEYGDGWIRITWANDPAPEPGPGPTPTPTPDPQPPTPPPAPVATGKLWLTYVFDEATETQDQARVKSSLTDSAELIGLGATTRAYDDNQDVIDRLQIRDKLGELPCIVVQEQKAGEKTAAVIKVLPKVQDKDSVVAAVRALRGAAK